MPLAPEQLKQLDQLEAARHLVLADSVLYSQIVQGILPIVGAHAHLEFRRWGAEFLAETFASPLLAPQQKENSSVVVLQTVKELLEQSDQDNGVVKALIQAAASIYPHIFRYMYVITLCHQIDHFPVLFRSLSLIRSVSAVN